MRLIPYLRRNEFPVTNRQFEDFFRDFPIFSHPETGDQWNPAVDVLEKDGKIMLRAELPGMTEKQIEVNRRRHLILKGERKMESEEKKENYHRIEFSGSFSVASDFPGCSYRQDQCRI
jgi:HSP20 family protein